MIYPTFITEYPVSVSPLSKTNENNADITDRFELFICGKEIANGFSELNDALEQKNRFELQIKNDVCKNEHDNIDTNYITALEHGLPPTAGEGIGIDRLVMLLSNSNSIRDVLLFPSMKRK